VSSKVLIAIPTLTLLIILLDVERVSYNAEPLFSYLGAITPKKETDSYAWRPLAWSHDQTRSDINQRWHQWPRHSKLTNEWILRSGLPPQKVSSSVSLGQTMSRSSSWLDGLARVLQCLRQIRCLQDGERYLPRESNGSSLLRFLF